MLSLISPIRAFQIVAIVYTLFVTITITLCWLLVPDFSVWSSVRIVFGGALFLNITLLVIVHIFWKWLWAKIPILNTLIFPDLNGRWDMEIHWIGHDKNGTVNATATIRQNFLHMSMEVASDGSDSETLIAKPKKDPESGRPILYYVYRVVPKKLDFHADSSYEGAAILKFESTKAHRLSGNYFTSKKTVGHFTLRRERPLK